MRTRASAELSQSPVARELSPHRPSQDDRKAATPHSETSTCASRCEDTSIIPTHQSHTCTTMGAAQSPLHSSCTGMSCVAHTGFRFFLITGPSSTLVRLQRVCASGNVAGQCRTVLAGVNGKPHLRREWNVVCQRRARHDIKLCTCDLVQCTMPPDLQRRAATPSRSCSAQPSAGATHLPSGRSLLNT